MQAKLPPLLVIGNCIIDQIWELPHFPRQDSEFRALRRTQRLGGNACNSCMILAQLGHSVSLVTQLAEDSEAQWIQQQLAQHQIDVSLSPSSAQGITPLSSIWLNTSNGSRTICHYRELKELDLQSLQRLQLKNYQWLHFEGRNVAVLREYLATLGSSRPVPVSLEIEKPLEGIEQLLPYIDVVVVSNAYLQHKKISVTDCLHHFATINPRLKIVCTQGEQGLSAQHQESGVIKIEAEPVSAVVDSIGAGDSFIAGLISRLSQGVEFTQALVFANRLAASKIQHQGMQFDAVLKHA